MITSVAQYILSMKNFDRMARTLGNRRIYAIPVEGDSEQVRCSIGNSVIVFEVMCEGEHKAMRVYMRPHHNLRAIYGEHYFAKELLVGSGDDNFGLADVVLCDWYEGHSLQAEIERVCAKPVAMAALSRLFEHFAMQLLDERWAHGDLKPENIIISDDGLHLIDFDAMYREGFSTDDCIEIGTRQFQHPLRDKSHFGRYIDDYPIALITTALAALAADKSLGHKIMECDYLLIRPELAVKGEDEMLQHIERLFARQGDARHYRIARLLRSPHPSLPSLRGLLDAKPLHTEHPESLTLEYYGGLWGFAVDGRFIIPPLYDLAFEFSEGLALVRIGEEWHFIDTEGNIAISCGAGTGIKPLRNGSTRISRVDGEYSIFRDGRIEKI